MTCTFSQQAMISTIGTWPVLGSQNMIQTAHFDLCERFEGQLSSRAFKFKGARVPSNNHVVSVAIVPPGMTQYLNISVNKCCRNKISPWRRHSFDLRWSVNLCGTKSEGITNIVASDRFFVKSRNIKALVGSENGYCDRSDDQPQGVCNFRRSNNPNNDYLELPEGSDPDQLGYTIKVSKELMGVFRYVEKVKRARIKELADTLRQTAGACMFFSCVRGIVSPLVEVFKTQPPNWGKLILMLSAFDSLAITYLALKASEPLEKLSMLASESEHDIMGSIEKEEEHLLALAVELVKLFRRLRNITMCTAVAQFASLTHSFLQLKNPQLTANVTKAIRAWLNSPWN